MIIHLAITKNLCALIKYLQDIVVPAVNRMPSAVTTISEAVEQLQKYVEDYSRILMFKKKSITSLMRWLKLVRFKKS